jgi:hypothetical protein
MTDRGQPRKGHWQHDWLSPDVQPKRAQTRPLTAGSADNRVEALVASGLCGFFLGAIKADVVRGYVLAMFRTRGAGFGMAFGAARGGRGRAELAGPRGVLDTAQHMPKPAPPALF